MLSSGGRKSAPLTIVGLIAISTLLTFAITLAYLLSPPPTPPRLSSLRTAYTPTTRTILSASSSLGLDPWTRLSTLSDTFGSRLSGSPGLAGAIEWLSARLSSLPGVRVSSSPVQIPLWSRISEHAALLQPRAGKIDVRALGGSISTTGKDGEVGGEMEADVVVVEDWDELDRLGEAGGVENKICVLHPAWEGYDKGYPYRSHGASRAAKWGAVAVLVRSLSPVSIGLVHVGGMRYDEGVEKIPAGSIAVEDADMLARMQERGDPIRMVLALNVTDHNGALGTSANLVAEIEGRTHPEQVVLLGAHIDAWDVGTGAMDDGGGVVACWHVLQVLSSLGLAPARTIRVVFFTNEENGLAGGKAYANALSDADVANHVLAIETDSGTFEPTGFSWAQGSQATLDVLSDMASLLVSKPLHIDARRVVEGETGADISPLLERGVPTLELVADGGVYFHYHHTRADTPDKIDPVELNKCIGVLASLVFIAADSSYVIPR